jgi:hypothetical protein
MHCTGLIMADSIRIKNLIDGEWLVDKKEQTKESLVGNNKVQGKEGFDFFTQNKVSTIRVAAPAGLLAADAVPDKPAEITASKGDVRSCIAS